jgi:hypothetical protein
MSETHTYNPMPEGNPNAKPTKVRSEARSYGKQPKKDSSKKRDRGDFLESRAKKFSAE